MKSNTYVSVAKQAEHKPEISDNQSVATAIPGDARQNIERIQSCPDAKAD